MLNNIKTIKKDRGFTIVELLIVIVVIGILAAITLVAYGNITTRANANAAKANATNVTKVAEAYNADENTSGYPTMGQITGYTTNARIPSGLTLQAAAVTSANANGKTLQYLNKGNTGACVGYWDGTTVQYMFAGNAVSVASGTTCN